MFREPNSVIDGHLLQLEAGARLDAGYKAHDRNGMYNLCFDFHPVESLFIDPELSLHSGQHLGFSVGRLIAWLGCCLQYINVERTRFLLAHELKVESLRISSVNW